MPIRSSRKLSPIKQQFVPPDSSPPRANNSQQKKDHHKRSYVHFCAQTTGRSTNRRRHPRKCQKAKKQRNNQHKRIGPSVQKAGNKMTKQPPTNSYSLKYAGRKYGNNDQDDSNNDDDKDDTFTNKDIASTKGSNHDLPPTEKKRATTALQNISIYELMRKATTPSVRRLQPLFRRDKRRLESTRPDKIRKLSIIHTRRTQLGGISDTGCAAWTVDARPYTRFGAVSRTAKGPPRLVARARSVGKQNCSHMSERKHYSTTSVRVVARHQPTSRSVQQFRSGHFAWVIPRIRHALADHTPRQPIIID